MTSVFRALCTNSPFFSSILSNIVDSEHASDQLTKLVAEALSRSFSIDGRLLVVSVLSKWNGWVNLRVIIFIIDLQEVLHL